MSYHPIIKSSDNRLSKQACTLTSASNVQVEKVPPGERRRSAFFLGPTPGLSEVLDAGGNIRGIFSQVGCRSGNMFAVAGGSVLQIPSSFSSFVIGSVTGGDPVTFAAFRTSLALRSFGTLYLYDGSFSSVSDADAPTFAQTLAVVQFRAVAAYQDGDGFSWSGAGTFGTWPTGGAAADLYLPDKIVAQIELGGRLASFNAASTQFWDPTIGAETEAFQLVQGLNILVGAVGREAVAKTRDGAVLIGHDRCIYVVRGTAFQRIENPDIELALQARTPIQLESAKVWVHRRGSKEIAVFNIGIERAFAYDFETQTWSDRTRYGKAEYDLDFCCEAFGATFVASSTDTKIWKLDADVLTDDGETILREMTVHAPVAGDVPIDEIVIDAEWFAQDDDGERPSLSLEVSMDGGRSWCEPRQLVLPHLGEYGFRVRDFQFGMAFAEWGVLVRLRLGYPIKFAVYGIWINPSSDEAP